MRAVPNRIFFWQSTATTGYFADVSQFPNRFVLELAVGEPWQSTDFWQSVCQKSQTGNHYFQWILKNE
jgi:hypothetical protein